jgi:aminoglycoside phosphotransferase family enzyme/predicted kinase
MYRGAPPVAVHETHASWVFVAGERAYKVKKPLALDFLDYSTLALRHRACREEVRVNRELAPGLYLGVRAIVRSEKGFRIAPDGSPDALEYVVAMRSFSARDTFAGLIATGSLTETHVTAAAFVLAAFHRRADVVADWGSDRVLALWRRNVEELRHAGPPAGWRVDVAAGFGETFVTALEPKFDRRGQLGLARDGHGDLRCEHVLAGPTVRVVDRIEFDPSLRRSDVAFDLAFLEMDLEASGQRWAARELVRAYRDAGMDPGDETLRSFYAAHWALVRAKVTLIAAAEHDGAARTKQLRRAQRLWSLCDRLCWRARAPLTIVVCGPAASGKSVLAGELSRRSRMPVVCSDEVRKRLAHLSPSQPARREHYSADFNRLTYEQLSHDALLALQRQDGVIVDATCRSRKDRAVLLDPLREVDVPMLIVRCEIPLELALTRAAQRMGEPQRISDATPRIAVEQFHSFEELDEHSEGTVLTLDTAQDLDGQIAEIARAVDAARLSAWRLETGSD